MNRSTLVFAGIGAVAAAVLVFMSSGPRKPDHVVDVAVPELSATATGGESLFIENCAACHGENAAGTASGPPLIHKYYEPSHHDDGAFHAAVMQGVRAHHWRFGNMPPVEGLEKQDVGSIIAYVREVQRANGIN
jgi:mono/diheme cytochrome c family protein